MRVIKAFILVLMSFSICAADNSSMEKAYSLYNHGKMETAIELIKDYVKEHPDAKALYFLGYAYYKTKKMDIAARYFNEAYLIDPDFSPIPVLKEIKTPD